MRIVSISLVGMMLCGCTSRAVGLGDDSGSSEAGQDTETMTGEGEGGAESGGGDSAGTGDDDEVPTVCGDGALEPGEFCDPGLDGACQVCPVEATAQGLIFRGALDDPVPNIGALSGSAVAIVGDVDGDGRDDVLVGAPRADLTSSTDRGLSYLFLGAELSGLASGTVVALEEASLGLVGADDEHASGSSVAGVGDVDGDGLDDLAIGAPMNDLGGDGAGAVHIVLGASLNPPVGVYLGAADHILVGEAPYFLAGGSIAGAGDMDGDGLDDILVGVPRQGEGKTFLVLGKDLVAAGGSGQSLGAGHYAFVGDDIGDSLGAAVSSAGDVDGDGRDDLLIGAPQDDTAGANAGAALLYLAKDVMAAPPGATLSVADASVRILGDSAGDLAGMGVARAGDVDGDELDDVLIGASSSDAVAVDAGKTYLVRGRQVASVSPGTAVPIFDLAQGFVGENLGDLSGYALGGGGDVDGDGRDDFVIGAPNSDVAGESSGSSYLIFSTF